MIANPDSLLQAWFGEDLDTPQAIAARSRLWFAANDSFDDLLREQFGGVPDRALRGELASWRDEPRSTLALVLALDQLPRNLFRGTPQAFAYDSAGLELSRWALSRGFDTQLHPVEAAFFYFPLEHAESPSLQSECVTLFRALLQRAPDLLSDQFQSFLSYAERHQSVIERFGRFPHRNGILGRSSTPEEAEYLEAGGETFSGTAPVA
jgi:uncharacterized protein (DUF924 family)